MGSAEEKYKDIFYMPHHRSAKHAPMAAEDRAAQFAPFAALTGFDAQIDEAARFTDSDVALDESQKEMFSLVLSDAAERLAEGAAPFLRVTYFAADRRKSGGELLSAEGKLKKIDPVKKLLVFADGTQVPIEAIRGISS